MLNSEFQKVVLQEGNESTSTKAKPFQGDTLTRISFNIDEVRRTVKRRETCALGPDSVDPKVLRECASTL